jgi:hypothetical protein
VALRRTFDYRDFFTIEERRDMFEYLKLSKIKYQVITRKSNGKYNYPDFIIDNQIGIEITHYKDPVAGQFYKFLYAHDDEFMNCNDLVAFMGENADKIFKRIRPTIANNKIFAWSEPLSDVYNTNLTHNMLFKRIDRKLKNYNNSHYKVYKQNILLARVYFIVDKNNLSELRKVINIKYPNISKKYNLTIVAYSDYAVSILSLGEGIIGFDYLR